jgi:hypothetical protein
MVPFDGQGPQQGQPAVAPPSLSRGPMPPGHGPSAPSPGGQMHHQAMNPPPFARRGSASGMPGQPPFPIPPQSPANRQGSFNNMPSGGQYSSHPPLHSPHQQQGGPPPILPHPSIPHPSQQLHRNNSMNRQHGMGQMPPMPNQHDMRASQQSNSQGNHSRQQYMGSSGGGGSGGGGSGGGGSGGLSGSWQSDKDTPHRREMIQHM